VQYLIAPGQCAPGQYTPGQYAPGQVQYASGQFIPGQGPQIMVIAAQPGNYPGYIAGQTTYQPMAPPMPPQMYTPTSPPMYAGPDTVYDNNMAPVMENGNQEMEKEPL